MRPQENVGRTVRTWACGSVKLEIAHGFPNQPAEPLGLTSSSYPAAFLQRIQDSKQSCWPMMSLENDTDSSAKFQTLKPFFFPFFFALACERIIMKTQSIESRCYRTGKYTVCRRVRVSFSSECFTGCGSEGVKLNMHVPFKMGDDSRIGSESYITDFPKSLLN